MALSSKNPSDGSSLTHVVLPRVLRRHPISLDAAVSEAGDDGDADVFVAAALDAAKTIPFVSFLASVVPRALLRRPLPPLLDDSTLLASVVIAIASSDERFLMLRRRLPLASFVDDECLSLTTETFSVGLSPSSTTAAAAVGKDNRRGFLRRRIEGKAERGSTGSCCKLLADDDIGLIDNGEESK